MAALKRQFTEVSCDHELFKVSPGCKLDLQYNYLRVSQGKHAALDESESRIPMDKCYEFILAVRDPHWSLPGLQLGEKSGHLPENTKWLAVDRSRLPRRN